MRILEKNDIAQAIKNCDPSEIAVAYVGEDWRNYLGGARKLNSIILSPTLGTNPKAVGEIAKEIGWENVHFLDELHAKIYLGKKLAVIGSANLTNNGLSGQGLREVCVELTNLGDIIKLRDIFSDLLGEAQKQYPSEVEKKAKLLDLLVRWNTGVARGVIQSSRKIQLPDITNFEPWADDHFYVTWWTAEDDGGDLAEDLKERSDIGDYLHFSPRDKIVPGKWILCWRKTKADKADGRAPLTWMYIDEVVKRGYQIPGYDDQQLAIQLHAKYRVGRQPEAPFQITKNVVDAFRKAVIEKDIEKDLVQSKRIGEGQDWSLKLSLKGMPKLVKRIKEILLQN